MGVKIQVLLNFLLRGVKENRKKPSLYRAKGLNKKVTWNIDLSKFFNDLNKQNNNKYNKNR